MSDLVILPTFREKMERGYLSIPYFAHEILEVPTHAEQDQALNLIRMKKESAIVCGNRWGKGDTIKILGSWIATYVPVQSRFKKKKLDILNTSISQDQANIVYDKFLDTCTESPRWSFMISDTKKSPFPHVVFKSGVTWWFRNASQNGKYLEGRSYLWANFDEADLQPDFPKFIEDILDPRLWDYNGMLTWTTTPRRGRRNSFKRWEQLQAKIKSYRKNSPVNVACFRGDSRNNTFLAEEAVERMNNLPTRLLNKNVLGIYDDTDGIISHDMLDFCESIASGIETEPRPGVKYINTWDFARTSTFNVGVTIERADPLQLRSIERRQDPGRRNREYWKQVTEAVETRHNKFRGLTGLDGTGLGDVLSSFLTIPHIPFNFGKGHGALRQEVIDVGLGVIQAGEIGLPLSDPRLNPVVKGELWSARDELIDFEPDSLDHTIWDFVCALFMGIFIAKGHTINGRKKHTPSMVSIPIIKGVSRHVMA